MTSHLVLCFDPNDPLGSWSLWDDPVGLRNPTTMRYLVDWWGQVVSHNINHLALDPQMAERVVAIDEPQDVLASLYMWARHADVERPEHTKRWNAYVERHVPLPVSVQTTLASERFGRS